jgi:hypothetical protein
MLLVIQRTYTYLHVHANAKFYGCKGAHLFTHSGRKSHIVA